MCIYTVKKQNKKYLKKKSSRGVRDTTEGPKIGRSWRKVYRNN